MPVRGEVITFDLSETESFQGAVTFHALARESMRRLSSICEKQWLKVKPQSGVHELSSRRCF